MGVNTPASAVVIVGLAHPGPVPQPYTVAEYKNIVGRAGRLGFAEHGTSYLLALSPQDEHYAWSHYVHGVPEDLESRFLDRGTDPRTVIVRVLIAARRSSANRLPAEAIIDFLENSFGAFQREQAAPNWTWNREQLVAALRNLEHHRLVEQDGAGGYSLTALGSLAGEGWIEVESITRLVDTLAQVSVNALTDTSLVAAAQLTVELDNQHFPMNKRSTNKEPYAWRAAMEQQQVHPAIIAAFSRAITDPQQATLRAKKAAACLLWITPLPLAEIEQRLTQFGGRNTDAAGEIRAVASRTCDILPAVVRVAELIHPDLNLADRHRRLLTRMEAGVPPAAVDLAAYAGGRLSRADYHRLLQADLCSIDNINAATDETLIPYLGTGQRGAEKLQVLRAAVRAYHQDQAAQMPMGPLLPPYES
jgi:replicative superfamily II helicase